MMVCAVIQARMASKRLPGKVLKKIDQEIVLSRVIANAKASKLIDEVIVATTKNKADDKIVNFCEENRIKYFRGSEADVLGRYAACVKNFACDTVVRITADNPLGQPKIFDLLIKRHIFGKNDYTYSVGFPLGTSCEVFSKNGLRQAAIKAKEAYQREHIGTFFLVNPLSFKIGKVIAPKKYQHDNLRLTVDTNEDLKTVKNIVKVLGPYPSLENIVRLRKEKPSLFLNKKIKQSYPNKQVEQYFRV